MPRKINLVSSNKKARGTAYASDKNPDRVKIKRQFNPATMERVWIPEKRCYVERLKAIA